MSFRLFDTPFPEPSAAIGFSGGRIVRQSEGRDDNASALALAEPNAAVMLIAQGRLVLRVDNGRFDPYFGAGDAVELGALAAEAILLGHLDGRPILAAPTGIDLEALPDGVKAIDFRSINIQGLLEADDLGALAQGAALLAWNQSHGFCSRCGTQSMMKIGGYKRSCPSCGADHFPRTDPVAIMLAVTRDRCLMGRGRHFGPGMYSALAGFIEPGETIEDAVRRETLEESGIRLGRVVYHASQPWPFPYSLMIGCFGEALNEDIDADLTELEDCRWFSRDEVMLALSRNHPDGIFVPPKAAIAHHLIRTWAEGG